MTHNYKGSLSPVGTVSKPAGHLPCNCGRTNGDHAPHCQSLWVEVVIGVRPSTTVTSATGKAIGHTVERETDDAYRHRINQYLRSNWMVLNDELQFLLTRGNAQGLDRVGEALNMPRHNSDLPINAPVHAWRCACGKPVPFDGLTCASCAAKNADDLDMARMRAHFAGCSVSTNGDSVSVVGRGVDKTVVKAPISSDSVDARWNVYGELLKQKEQWIAKGWLGTNAAKPSLEWLARELGLAPDASEELLRAEVKKRLSGQWDVLTRTDARNAELVMRADSAQRKVESLLHDAAEAAKENDDLRAMVADLNLTIRQMQRKGRK